MGDLTAALRETLDTFAPDGTPLTTSEVAEALDLGRRSTYDRLDRLVDADELRTKKVGASARVWWRNDTGDAALPDAKIADASTNGASTDAGAGAVENPPLVDVLESSPTGVAAFADDGTCATANEQFRTLFGLDGDVSLEALEAVPLTDHDGDVIGAADRPVRRVRRTNRPVVDEHVRVDTDDGHRWVSMTVQESDDGVVVTASDVTGVVERSRRLRRERDAVAAELSEFASHAVDSRLKLDEDGTVLSVDDRAAALLEPDVVELVGASTSEAFDALRGASAIVDAALESESKQTGDCRHGDRDAWFEVEAVPTTSGASVLLREVTEQVEHERELQRYVGVVDALGEPVYELDSEGRFAFVNDAITELSGYSREELLGEHVSLVIPDDAVDRIEPQISELLTEDAPDRVRSEYHVTTKRGHAVPVENRLTVLTDEAGNVRGNAGFVSDITERKERERELERYERIVETVEDGIYVLDQEDRFVVVNDAFASMAGVDGEDIIGQKASIVFDETFAERVNDRNAALSADTLESAKFEETFAPVDGDPLVVETRFDDVRVQGREHRTRRCGAGRRGARRAGTTHRTPAGASRGAQRGERGGSRRRDGSHRRVNSRGDRDDGLQASRRVERLRVRVDRGDDWRRRVARRPNRGGSRRPGPRFAVGDARGSPWSRCGISCGPRPDGTDGPGRVVVADVGPMAGARRQVRVPVGDGDPDNARRPDVRRPERAYRPGVRVR